MIGTPITEEEEDADEKGTEEVEGGKEKREAEGIVATFVLLFMAPKMGLMEAIGTTLGAGCVVKGET